MSHRGRIVHKDKHYPGAHAAIVDEALWDEVQRHLAANRIALSISRLGDGVQLAANPGLQKFEAQVGAVPQQFKGACPAAEERDQQNAADGHQDQQADPAHQSDRHRHPEPPIRYFRGVGGRCW